MRGKRFTVALLAAAGVLAWSGASRGGDTVRLKRGANTPTRRLVEDGRGADTVRAWHRGFGWGWGGYRGFGWGGFYRPYFGGLGFYRPYYGLGFYRPYLGLGLYRPYYGFGLGYGLRYGGFYPSFSFGWGGFFGPCAGTSAGVFTLKLPAAPRGTSPPALAQPRAVDPPPRKKPNGDTFPYDGGPTNPVPKPKDTPPSSTTPRSVPLEGLSVALPKAATKWTYPAYGETARRIAPPSARTYLTRGGSKKTGSR